MSREYGKMCPQPSVARPFGCNNIVATWVRGSDVSTTVHFINTIHHLSPYYLKINMNINSHTHTHLIYRVLHFLRLPVIH